MRFKYLSHHCGAFFLRTIDAAHEDAAWEFIRFMSTARAQRIRNEADRMLSESQGRLYMPRQSPIKLVNEELYRTYVLDNPELPERFQDGFRVFNDLLPHCMFRPVTPAGQLLWNEHVYAMEEALLDKRSPRDALEHWKK